MMKFLKGILLSSLFITSAQIPSAYPGDGDVKIVRKEANSPQSPKKPLNFWQKPRFRRAMLLAGILAVSGTAAAVVLNNRNKTSQASASEHPPAPTPTTPLPSAVTPQPMKNVDRPVASTPATPPTLTPPQQPSNLPVIPVQPEVPDSNENKPELNQSNSFTIMHGVKSIQGRRQHMEDYYQATPDLTSFAPKNDGVPRSFYGVFDGHGGPHAAEFTTEHLHKNVASFLNKGAKSALEEGFEKTDKDFLAVAEKKNYDAGTTAIVALIEKGILYIANVGDSRAVLCKNGKAIPLSVDQKPNSDSEKERIKKLGGIVVFYGTWRVQGVLAVARAIGDRKLKTFVPATPEISERPIEKDDEFVILASDGLWDVISNQEAVDFVKEGLKTTVPDAIAKALVEQAYNKGSLDNITALIIKLNPMPSQTK